MSSLSSFRLVIDFRRYFEPTPIVQMSIGVHVLVIGLLIGYPGLWPFWLGIIVANHLILVALMLWPRSTAFGANISRLTSYSAAAGEVALTIDDGPDPIVTPAVLDILDQYQVTATFFCIGEYAQRYPELCRDIVRRGHAVENHSMFHRHSFALSLPNSFRRELEKGQDTLTAITGQVPLFFRAPAGLRNPFLNPVLRQLNLRLTSWTRRGFDTCNRNPTVVLTRLTRNLRAGDILLLHDGHAAITVAGKPVILDVLGPLLARIHEQGLRCVSLRAAFRLSTRVD